MAPLKISEYPAQNALLRLPVVDGELSSPSKASTLRWAVTIGHNGAISIVFEPLEVKTATAWSFDAAFAKGRTLPPLSVRGVTPEGVVVESESVHILDCNTTSDATGTRLSLGGEASRLRLIYRPLPKESEGIHVAYLTAGMRSFGCPSIDTSLGRVTLVAPTKIDNPDHVNGRVHVQAGGDARPLAEWLSECDRLVERILGITSFAEGGFFRWSVRQLESSDCVLAIDCEGARSPGLAWDGAFHYLNLEPVLELAVTRYTEELCQRTGLAVALEWFVHHPRYAELQLISAMTALEHLVSVFVQHQGAPRIVAPDLFDTLHKRTQILWEETIEKAPEDAHAALKRLKEKLGNLNEGSFRDKLEDMLLAYKVPLFGLELGRINQAVIARNRVVHRGLHRSKDQPTSIQEHIAVLRELLKRTFLTLLGYQGQYFSLLNGPDWIQFPPSVPPQPASTSS